MLVRASGCYWPSTLFLVSMVSTNSSSASFHHPWLRNVDVAYTGQGIWLLLAEYPLERLHDLHKQLFDLLPSPLVLVYQCEAGIINSTPLLLAPGARF